MTASCPWHGARAPRGGAARAGDALTEANPNEAADPLPRRRRRSAADVSAYQRMVVLFDGKDPGLLRSPATNGAP